MDDKLFFGIGAVVALALIWRFATKKTKSGGRQPGGVVVRVASGAAPDRAAAGGGGGGLGTIITVNAICLGAFVAGLVAAFNIEADVIRSFSCLGILIAGPVVAGKYLETQYPGDRYSLVGALCALCILAWVFGSLFYFSDACRFFQGLLNG